MKQILLAATFLALTTISAYSQCEETEKTKILLVGDSWAAFMHNDGTLNNTLKHWGHSNYTYYSNNTLAVNGAETDDFQEESRLLELKNQLLDQPSIEAVHLSIGGNDFLGGWNVSMTEAEANTLGESVYDNIVTLIEFIKDVRPNLHVVWSGYMYPNFEENIEAIAPLQTSHPFYATWEGMGFPTFEQLNNVLNNFSAQMEDLAASDERVHFISVPALMQYHYGQEEPLAVAPGGTYPIMSQPLPFGDVTYPSPKASMRDYGVVRDCFHLSVEGYFVMMDYQMQKFYQKFLMDDYILNPTVSEENGFVSSSGTVGSIPKLGEADGEAYKMLLSFETTSMPDTIIDAASIFLRRDSVSVNTPVGTTVNVKIKNGAFGADYTVSADDYTADGDDEAEACVFGMNEQDGNWLRIELPASFFPYLTNSDKTQFIITTDAEDEKVIYFASDTDPEFAPVLNIDFKNDFTAVKNEKSDQLSVFPNPTKNELTFITSTPKIIQHIVVYDLKGKNVLTVSNPTANTIDVSALPQGHYVLKIATDDNVIVKKFIKK